MRRSLFVLFLSVICLVLTPAPAGAWFWRWIDDLSGPQFQGFSLEVKFYCFGQSAKARHAMLKEVERRLDGEAVYFRRKVATTRAREAYYHDIAARLTENIRKQVDSLLGEPDTTVSETDKLLREVARIRLYARVASDGRIDSDSNESLFTELKTWLQTLDRGYSSDLKIFVESRTVSDPRAWNALLEAGVIRLTASEAFVAEAERKARGSSADAAFLLASMPVLSGGRLSVCKFNYLDVDRFFLSANIGYGWETKPENRGRGLKLATVGGSFHWTIVPALTVGVGGGKASFFARSPRGNLHTEYVEAPIIEVKPLTLLAGNPRFQSPWAHALYIRYSGTIFPGGFEPDQFFAGSPEYRGPEYINSLGLFLDVEPFLRNRRGKWWKGKP